MVLLPVELVTLGVVGVAKLLEVALLSVSIGVLGGNISDLPVSPRLEEENGTGLVAVRLGGVGEVCEGAICANLVPNNVRNRVIEGCKDSSDNSSRFWFRGPGDVFRIKGEVDEAGTEGWSVRRTRL